MEYPHSVTVCDVGPRDGFQMEEAFIPTERKVAVVDALARAGLPEIEATSFVHPRAIPQMRDAEEVMVGITRRPETQYMALVPNAVGARRALAAGVGGLGVVVAASELFNRANVNMTHDESFANLAQIIELAAPAGVPVVLGIATAFGCPYTGPVDPALVEGMVERAWQMGIREVGIADSTGMACPPEITRLTDRIRQRWPEVSIGLHFHNTRGLGLANVLAGLQAGVTKFDASIAGLGGCPFAPGASGNIPTEDLVHMLHCMGIATGIDLDTLLEAAALAEQVVGRTLPGQVMRSGPRWRLTPIPALLQEPAGPKRPHDIAALTAHRRKC